jgi:hypothetical protein
MDYKLKKYEFGGRKIDYRYLTVYIYDFSYFII